MQTKVEVCLDCLDFPCTCGKQYRNLKDYQLEEIIINLQDLLKRRGHQIQSCKVDNLDIAERRKIDGDKEVPLFEKDEIESLIKNNILSQEWVNSLSTEKHLDLLWNKLSKTNPDDFPLPGLFMLVLYLKYISVAEVLLPGNKLGDLLEKIIHTFFKESPIEMFLNQVPKEITKRPFVLRECQFVEIMNKTQNSTTANVANQIYHIYLDIYDAHIDFEHMTKRFCTLLGTIAGVQYSPDPIDENKNILSSVMLQTKERDTMYYTDIDLAKMLVSMDFKFIIDPLIA